MTDEPAAIQASFADFRLIKGRKQAQIILEIPIEGADAALAALGGIPQPHSDRWVAVARLNGIAKPEPEAKEKRKWEDLKLSLQARIRCNEPAFRRFLQEQHFCKCSDAENAADDVRYLCDVSSRSVFNDNPEAASRWNKLDREYKAWLKAAE